MTGDTCRSRFKLGDRLVRLGIPLRHVGRTDRRLVRWLGALPPSRVDDGLLWLTKVANKSGLWWVVATVLAARKGSTRRAALRGVAAIAGASAAANLVGKPAFPRRRPAAEEVPEHRLADHPNSSSFPSGHAASAAAFATAVAMESPLAGLAVAPIAAAVAYSRVHTGMHWPSDVATGALVGIGAAAATRHWWPLPAAGPAQAAHPADAPIIRGGEDVLIVVNPASGADDHDPDENVRSTWPKASVIYAEPNQEISAQLSREIAARAGRVRALGVAGGDGTVAAVAAVAAEHQLPLALIPAGTRNHLARDVGVATLADTAHATAAGSAVGIGLVEVNIADGETQHHRWFVNTASLGGYPEMVRAREKLQQRRPRWPSTAIATAHTLRHATPLRIALNGKRRAVWLLFIGNGTYTPTGLAPTGRSALDTGLLDVRYLRADVPYSRARFVLAVLTNTLNTSHIYRQHDLPSLNVELLDGHRRVALDGEVGPLGNRFTFRAHPGALTIYRP